MKVYAIVRFGFVLVAAHVPPHVPPASGAAPFPPQLSEQRPAMAMKIRDDARVAVEPLAPLAAELPFGLTGRVSDHAGVLTQAERSSLESMLAGYETETSHQLAVLIVPHLAGLEIEAYALRTANGFGLGRKGIDNGMLLVVAIRERKIRIELGRGFENVFSDEDARRIIVGEIGPELAAGRFAEGLSRGVTAMMARGRLLVAPRR
jgi:uncharacterized membrane protein YgcG